MYNAVLQHKSYHCTPNSTSISELTLARKGALDASLHDLDSGVSIAAVAHESKEKDEQTPASAVLALTREFRSIGEKNVYIFIRKRDYLLVILFF